MLKMGGRERMYDVVRENMLSTQFRNGWVRRFHIVLCLTKEASQLTLWHNSFSFVSICFPTPPPPPPENYILFNAFIFSNIFPRFVCVCAATQFNSTNNMKHKNMMMK